MWVPFPPRLLGSSSCSDLRVIDFVSLARTNLRSTFWMNSSYGSLGGEEWAEIFSHGCLDGLDLSHHYLLEHDVIAEEIIGGGHYAFGPFGAMGTSLSEILGPEYVGDQLTLDWPSAQSLIGNDCSENWVGAGNYQCSEALPIFREEQPLGFANLFSSLPIHRTDPPIWLTVITNLQRQSPRFEGDLYTALWVRGEGIERAGWCGFCSSWHKLKDSAYWYHLHYTHGIAYATGQPLEGPQEMRWTGVSGWNVLCGGCHKWLTIGIGDKARTCYFRHAHKCLSKAPQNSLEPARSRATNNSSVRPAKI